MISGGMVVVTQKIWGGGGRGIYMGTVATGNSVCGLSRTIRLNNNHTKK